MSDLTVSWYPVCKADEIGEEDVFPYEQKGRSYAIYHTRSGFYATDGLCTHEEETLADGVVIGEIIECPRHQGRFDIRSGKAKGAPVCTDLQTYPTRVDAGVVYIGLPY